MYLNTFNYRSLCTGFCAIVLYLQSSSCLSMSHDYQNVDKFLAEKTAGKTPLQKSQIILSASLKEQTIFADLFPDDTKLDDKVYGLLFENVSVNCADQFKHYLKGISNLLQPTETWVLQMLDAWGKFPSGILSGNLGMIGDFHECVQIQGSFKSEVSDEESHVKGKYCSTYVVPGPALTSPSNQSTVYNLGGNVQNAGSLEELLEHLELGGFPSIVPILGTCFPATCSNEDVQLILTWVNKNTLKDLTAQAVVSCSTDEKPPFDAGVYVMIVILSSIALVCICGTCIDLYGEAKLKNAPGVNILLAFSFYTNTRKWMSTKVGSDNLGCFHGLRFLTMSWILLCHIFEYVVSILVWNNWDLKTVHEDWTAYPILNGYMSVDTFFVLSGILVCYNLMKELDRSRGRFNYVLFVVHRYLRMMPTVMILIGTYATITPYLGSGPYWMYLEGKADLCRHYWWENLLLINNLMDWGEGKCYDLTWYLATEMQMFVFSPLVIYPLWKWRKVGFGIAAFLCVASMISPAVVIAHYNIPPTIVMHLYVGALTNNAYFAGIYSKPWTRFGSYLVGIIGGYVLYMGKIKPGRFEKIPRWFIILGWTLSTFFALAIIYGAKFYFDPKNTYETLHSVHAAIYGGMHRFVWGLCIAWIVFACVNGYGGWANKILSFKLFIPLGRLAFCMYLVQLQIVLPYYLSNAHPKHVSMYTTVIEFLGLLVLTGMVSYVVSMALEVPFMQLEKMIFPAKKRKPVDGGNVTAKESS